MFKLKSLTNFFFPKLMVDSGGGGGGPSSSTTQTSNIPEYARPYVETMLGATQKQLFDTTQKTDPTTGQTSTEITGIKGYTPFSTDMNKYFAGFQPLQENAFGAAANMGPAGQLGQATGYANEAIQRALGTTYQPTAYGNQFQAPGEYQAGQFNAQQVSAPELQQFQMGPAERVRTQSFTRPGAAEDFMSPYMQNVVDVQQREARRASDIAGQEQAAQAVGRGAFGGSRDAIMRAERERNLSRQLGDIQATGSQAAYNAAQQQFNAEQNARLQAQQANQQAGLTTGLQNLNALLGIQQLGSGQNLQSQLANQQYGLQAQQLGEQSRQFGAGQGLQAAGLGAQYGQAANQLTEQARQYGAGLGLQGAQAALQGVGQLGQLGQTEFGQAKDVIGLQNQLGTQQQQLEQNKVNQQIQNYATQQQWAMQQLAAMNNMLRGLPMQASSTQSYQAAPSAASQVAGLGLTGYGLSRMAAGGDVKETSAGLGAGALKRVMEEM